MTAWAMCMAYNEATMIRYWARHYASFCDKVIVYLDTDTDDGSLEIAESEGAEVRPCHLEGLNDYAAVHFAEEHYREARGQADWVIWTDADEFLYHPQLAARLDHLRAAGVTFPRTQGWSMLSDAPPTGTGQIYEQINRGIPAEAYAKAAIFDPCLDIQWQTGKHSALQAYGNVVRDDGVDPLKLLHYRWLGEDWFLTRNARNYSRLPADCIATGQGRETYPEYSGIYSEAWYRGQLEVAQVCV